MNIRKPILTAAIAAGLVLSAAGIAIAQPAPVSLRDSNQRVVEAFMADVLNGHHGDHAARYFTADGQWHGGTVGTVTGRDTIAGLMTAVVTSIPDLHAATQDVVVQGDEVVVRLVVTGTQKGDLLGIPASGRAVRWDATDLYRLKDGKISQEWAAEDFTAFLNDTGTYKAPWIQ
jgi:predicted ester cyclase